MFNGHQVVVCIPSGRERYMKALLPYLLSPRHSSTIDRINLWVNTDVPSDLLYFERLEQTYPKIKRVHQAGPLTKGVYDAKRQHYQFNDGVYRFYRDCTADVTAYVKIDDDIVYVHDDFFTRLLSATISRQQTNYACVANVFNVPHTTKLLQDRGTLGDALGHSPEGNPRCPVACTNGEFAAYIHGQFLQFVTRGAVSDLFFPSHQLTGRQRIGTMAWTGASFQQFGGNIGPRDEVELTTRVPEMLHKPLWMVGDALVSHFSFSHQNRVLEDQTNLLQQYQELSARLNGNIAV